MNHLKEAENLIDAYTDAVITMAKQQLVALEEMRDALDRLLDREIDPDIDHEAMKDWEVENDIQEAE